MNIQLKKFGLLLGLVLLGSCASPRKLVNKALKKDPTVLTPYLNQVIPDSEVISDSNCLDILLQPKYFNSIPTPRQELKLKKEEEKTERVRIRQQGKTDRVKEKESAEKAKEEEKTERVRERQEEKTERAVSDDNRRNERQKERTKRGSWKLYLILMAISFAAGFITRGKL